MQFVEDILPIKENLAVENLKRETVAVSAGDGSWLEKSVKNSNWENGSCHVVIGDGSYF